jgi:hypothetical protein
MAKRITRALLVAAVALGILAAGTAPLRIGPGGGAAVATLQ